MRSNTAVGADGIACPHDDDVALEHEIERDGIVGAHAQAQGRVGTAQPTGDGGRYLGLARDFQLACRLAAQMTTGNN